MISSCWTLRLKRRKAFSRDSPSCSLTSAKLDYTPKPAPVTVVNESGNGLSNVRGSVGLARTQEPHGGNAQFYVNLNDNAALDPQQTRWGYAVFGRVTSGMDVVDRIGNVSTGSRGPFKEDAPLQPVVIQRIERVAGP